MILRGGARVIISLMWDKKRMGDHVTDGGKKKEFNEPFLSIHRSIRYYNLSPVYIGKKISEGVKK